MRVLHLIPRRARALLLSTTAALVVSSVAVAAPAAASGQPPQANADSIRVAEGGVATALLNGAPTVLVNDVDAESDPLTAVLGSSPDHGTLSLDSDGSFSYEHDGSEGSTDSFTYRAYDGTSFSASVTVLVTVTPVNDAPVAVDDGYAVAEGAVLVVTAANRVTLNDHDAEDAPLTAVLVSGPGHGTLNLNANGTFTYAPVGSYAGLDSFTYRVSDGSATSNVATVSITVTPVNDAPVAVADSIQVSEGGSATTLTGGATSVLANDVDPENDVLTAQRVSGPARGVLSLQADGAFSYTHDGGETTTDSFTYRVSDGDRLSNTVTVTITITPVNDAPVAAADSISVPRGGSATTLVSGATSVLANDSDADDDPLTAAVVDDAQHGSLALNPNGTFTYSPDAGYVGPDSFTYRAGDGTAQSAPAEVAITVTSVNDLPVAVADGVDVAEAGTATTLVGGATSVLANDTDADDDALTAELVGDVTHGALALNADGTFSYVHDGSETTSDSFTYRASDGTATSSAVTVTITVAPVDDAPVAAGDSFTVAEGGTATSLTDGATSVLADDSDAENQPLTAVLVTGPTRGTLTLNADGTFSYVHDGSETTTDSFTYRASDGDRLSNTVTVSITVTPVNDVPVASADSATVAEGGTVTTLSGGATSVLANDTDRDDDPLAVELAGDVAHGTLALNPDGTFSYVHDGSETTSDSFTYRASDGTTTSATTTVALTIAAVNDAPVAVPDAYATAQDTTLTVATAARVTRNDTDAERDALSAVLGTGPAHGTLDLRPDGTFTYTPAPGYAGTDSFAYRAHDGAADSTPATVTLTVTARDDAPSISRLSDRVMKEGGRNGSIAFTVADDLTPAADLQVSAVSDDPRLVPRSALTVSGAGVERRLGLELPARRWGSAEITLTVADATGARSSTSFTLTVLRGRPCTIQGTAGDDVLVGTPGRDVICAGDGDDVIRGLGGDDVLRGGAGDDRILGGAGHDVLAGRAGDDILRGGAGNDRLLGGPGRDRISGGPGSDSVGRR